MVNTEQFSVNELVHHDLLNIRQNHLGCCHCYRQHLLPCDGHRDALHFVHSFTCACSCLCPRAPPMCHRRQISFVSLERGACTRWPWDGAAAEIVLPQIVVCALPHHYLRTKVVVRSSYCEGGRRNDLPPEPRCGKKPLGNVLGTPLLLPLTSAKREREHLLPSYHRRRQVVDSYQQLLFACAGTVHKRTHVTCQKVRPLIHSMGRSKTTSPREPLDRCPACARTLRGSGRREAALIC